MKQRITMLITAIAVMLGLATFMAPAASADTSITVESVSYSNDSASANVTKEERALINGVPQVTWENSNHGVKVTATQVKRAPKITTSCTSSNRLTQSQQIYNKTHGARVVVVKSGSCLWNRGMRDQIRVGFKYNVTTPVVLSLDSNRRYRHSFTLKTKLQPGDSSIGKVYVLGATRYIVKSCWNFIGGPVDVVVPQVVQVRYTSDVLVDITVEANASVKAKVEASLQCESGTLYGYAEASGSATASASIRVKSSLKVTATNAKKIELLNQVKASARAKAEASAKAKITLTCSDTPTYVAPSVSANAQACVEPGQATGIVTITATNNNNVAVPATYAFPGKSDQTATIAANATVAKQFTGIAPGSYTGTVSFGAPVNKTAQFNVTVEECVAPPTPAPDLIEIETINDVLVNNTRTITITGTVANGHTATLFSSAKNGGSITAGKTQTVSGSFTVQITYLAPDEVPGANNGVAAGHDQVAVTLTQDDGQKDMISTNQFEIRPAPVDPM